MVSLLQFPAAKCISEGSLRMNAVNIHIARDIIPYMPYIVFTERSAFAGRGVFGAERDGSL